MYWYSRVVKRTANQNYSFSLYSYQEIHVILTNKFFQFIISSCKQNEQVFRTDIMKNREQ